MSTNLDQLLQEYRQNGFVVVRQFLEAAALQELKDQLDRYIREVVPGLPADNAFYHDRDRPETLKQLNEMQDDPFFDEIRRRSPWVDLATRLLGEQAVAKHPQWFNKPPGIDHPTPPHQDNYYFCLDPDASITLWLAIDPVNQHNGCLRYLPGSHRGGLREHDASNVLGFSQGITDYGDEQKEREEEICCQPGDLVVHHGEMIHRADPNRTADQPRRAFAIVYRSESAKRDETAYLKYQERLSQQHQQMGLKKVDS